MSKRILEVVPYRSTWVDQFEQEKQGLLESINVTGLVIHHIGSTSVPGLAAKPIIDMLMECDNVDELDQHNAEFESLGYLPKGEFGIERRRYFQKGGVQRSHHLHAFAKGDEHVQRHLAFRDYLISHPEIRDQYQEIKLSAVALADNNFEKYMAHKNEFILFHEQQALKAR